ncbi:DNA gyrase inhibitor YacG [Escherichia coli]|nr:DNA gyrase inhibitor YacG [Escherichia coli]
MKSARFGHLLKRCQLIDLGEWAAEENESPAVAIFPKAMTGAKSQSSDILSDATLA